MRKFVSVMLSVALITLVAPHAACEKPGGVPMKAPPTVQPPAVAGQFYPADPAELKKMVDDDLAAAPVKQFAGPLVGLISPHAGYPYSGPISAAAFKQLQGKTFKRVVVLGLSHHVPLYGAALTTRDLYRTPLGDIPIDTASVRALMKKYPWAQEDPRPYAVEHSIEVELPFLQSVLKDFLLVPIIVGDAGAQTLDEIAKALDEMFPGGDTLFVASTDLSHYHPYADAQSRDRKTVGFIVGSDAKGYDAAVGRGDAELCGSQPVAVLKRLASLRGATFELIEYANSGDTAGDKSRVVGYAAIALIGKPSPASQPLGTAQQQALAALARATLTAHVNGRPVPKLPKDPALKNDGAAFVTLKKHGELRGCIGQIVATGPLDQTVQQMTIEAASHDPRFPPVTPSELKEIAIEISVLTPPTELTDPLAVRVGTDGLIISKGFRRGVLLPQVPEEQGWNQEQFLEGVSEKAGLPRDAWRDAKLERFQAIVFGEKGK